MGFQQRQCSNSSTTRGPVTFENCKISLNGRLSLQREPSSKLMRRLACNLIVDLMKSCQKLTLYQKRIKPHSPSEQRLRPSPRSKRWSGRISAVFLKARTGSLQGRRVQPPSSISTPIPSDRECRNSVSGNRNARHSGHEISGLALGPSEAKNAVFLPYRSHQPFSQHS